MLVIAGTFNVDPADRDAFLEAAKAVMAETLKEEGCHAYSFTPDVMDAGIVRLFERWDSEANLGPHGKSDHIRAFGRALKELKVTGRSITIYEVASEKAM